MKTTLVIAALLFSLPVFAKTLELDLNLGGNFSPAKGLSASPNNITVDSTTAANQSAVVGARFLLFPFANPVLGLGMDLNWTVQGAPTIASSAPALSSYTKYALSCTSSNGLMSVRLANSPIGGHTWWREEVRLLGMASLKANCELDYAGSNLAMYKNSANANSYAAALESSSVFFNFLRFGVEAGYRSYLSSGIVDEAAQPVVDNAGKAVKINMSSGYLTVNFGFDF